MPLEEVLGGDIYSIILQNSRNYEELLGPPQIELSPKEGVQRSEASGLPDGSGFEEDQIAPIGEPLHKGIERLSREARKAWEEWVGADNITDIIATPEVALLNCSIEDAMLTEHERLAYTRFRRLKFVEETRFQRREEAHITRLLEESPVFARSSLVSHEPVNRFYEERVVSKGEFGQTKIEIARHDRCQGKSEVRSSATVQIPFVQDDRFKPSYAEYLQQATLSSYQTEIWRKPSREEDNYLPNIGPQDDPDFVTPSDISSKNFNIYPPASRPYNSVFRVYTSETNYKLVYPSKQVSKDYTTVDSLAYMLRQKNYKYTRIQLDEVVYNKGQKKTRPNCKFEIDLRVTYGKEMTPDPEDYKKVDPDSKLGQTLLQLLNEQPHLFKEYVWEYTQDRGDGKQETIKKVAVGFTSNRHDSIGPRVYWVYLDTNANSVGKLKMLQVKRLAPQISYTPLKAYKEHENLPNYCKEKMEHPFLAMVRVSENFYFYHHKENRYINYDEVVDTFIKSLKEKGYVFFRQRLEDGYTSIVNFQFIHSSVKTKAQRRAVLQNLKSHDPRNG